MRIHILLKNFHYEEFLNRDTFHSRLIFIKSITNYKMYCFVTIKDFIQRIFSFYINSSSKSYIKKYFNYYKL